MGWVGALHATGGYCGSWAAGGIENGYNTRIFPLRCLKQANQTTAKPPHGTHSRATRQCKGPHTGEQRAARETERVGGTGGGGGGWGYKCKSLIFWPFEAGRAERGCGGGGTYLDDRGLARANVTNNQNLKQMLLQVNVGSRLEAIAGANKNRLVSSKVQALPTLAIHALWKYAVSAAYMGIAAAGLGAAAMSPPEAERSSAQKYSA